MRRKHDEGYALVFVLVVMVVLSLIAISLMTAALRNLQNQKATVAQMEAKYEAQGEMEKKIASYVWRIRNASSQDKGPFNNYEDAGTTPGVKSSAEYLLGLQNPKWINQTDIELELVTENSNPDNGRYQIMCTVILRNVITGEEPYYISEPVVEYKSYMINYAAPAEPSEGGAE